MCNNDRGICGRGHVDGEASGASESHVDEQTSDDIYQDPIVKVQEAEIRNAPRLNEEPAISDKKKRSDFVRNISREPTPLKKCTRKRKK